MLCIGLLLVAPGSAVTAAVYGDTGGLNLSLHQDVFAVSCTLAGAAGSELDAGQSCFTNASTDVIFLYGDAGFSQKTVTSISDAVVSGKVLVVGEKEINEETVTIRTRDNQIIGAEKYDEFLKQLKDEIKHKK